MKKIALYLSVLLGFAGLLSGCGVLGGHSEYARVLRGVWSPDGNDLLLVVWRFESSKANQPFHADTSIRNSRIEGYLVGRSRISSWEDGRWLDSKDLVDSERVFHYSDTDVPGSNSVAAGLAGEAYYKNTYFVHLGGTKGYRVFMGSGHYPRIIDFGASGSSSFSIKDIKLPKSQIEPLFDTIVPDLWPYFGIADIVPDAAGTQLAVLGAVSYFPDPVLGALGPQYFNYILTFFNADSPNSSPRVLRISETPPSPDSNGSWPEYPDNEVQFPVASVLNGVGAYEGILYSLNSSYAFSAQDQDGDSFVLVQGTGNDTAAVLMAFIPGDGRPAVQRFSRDEAPESLQLETNADGVPYPHVSGPLRVDGMLIETEIPDSSGEEARFRLRKL